LRADDYFTIKISAKSKFAALVANVREFFAPRQAAFALAA